MLRGGRGRARPVRGALLDRLAPTHPLGDARCGLSDRLAQGGYRGRGPGRSGRRSAALDRAGDPPPAVPTRDPETRRSHRRYRLVALAKAAPAAGAPLPLETPYSN